MNKVRKIKKILKSKPIIEGAGVHLKRAFGYYEAPLLDPFLLLDDFHSSNPDDYIAGFPWHPHRGIETITYLISGELEHNDSLGNIGIIRSGDCQWMTAGSGIIHQEMPKQKEKLLWGFQLWANLPKSHKMINPRYRDITRYQIPEMIVGKAKIKIISGEINGIKGPVNDIITEPEYYDISIPPYSTFCHSVRSAHTVLSYVINGEGSFDPNQRNLINTEHLIIFDKGNEINIQTRENSVRFLLISGKPIGEPIAWQGPIVMTTEKELRLAFEEYSNGTFIKYKP